MSLDLAVRRAQAYAFLSQAFLYPHENWTEDLPAMADTSADLGLALPADLAFVPLADLQAEHRRVFGLTGSLCYESEYGLPHEFAMSQELADIAGFYHAFGFKMGGPVRERPDHVSVELEFLYLLSLKEAHAIQGNHPEALEICHQARRRFLEDHLDRWLATFVAAVSARAGGGLFSALAQFLLSFVQADALQAGAAMASEPLHHLQQTPLPPDPSCETCVLAAEPKE